MSRQKQALITSRDDKGRHAVNLFAIEYDKAKLDKTGAQRLNEHGNELQAGIAKIIAELSVSNRFADEEAESSYTYPDEYKGPKPISDQIKALAKVLELSPAKALKYVKEVLPALELPNEAEGWFAIPSIDAMAKKHFSHVTDPAAQYCLAVQLIHEKIGKSRSFYNYREGKILPDRLRTHVRTVEMLKQVAETQPGDILIIAGQLGMKHRGKSVRRARETFAGNEFGLNSLAVGSIILTHPERLVRYDELDMDCAGDEFAPVAGSDFSRAPYFRFDDGRAEFGAGTVDSFYGYFGSASAFLPQS